MPSKNISRVDECKGNTSEQQVSTIQGTRERTEILRESRQDSGPLGPWIRREDMKFNNVIHRAFDNTLSPKEIEAFEFQKINDECEINL
ncbi:hypothetical protein RCL_jg12788.t1 [Rhizophagus clarus]|uniref:Uncharacterized protein n=1 Tax=Rhizophagus clarus TaxID=94130 RepID=A0A8H3KTK2_9GLOM|nr:hypothetical protein RCL_jg12788.t1 [Rhizophagus clarus]